MELVAETPVKTLQTLALNQPAKIEVIGIPQLSGKVRLLSAAINPTTQLGQVRLSIGNDTRLRVGAFGRAIIDLGSVVARRFRYRPCCMGPAGQWCRSSATIVWRRGA